MNACFVWGIIQHGLVQGQGVFKVLSPFLNCKESTVKDQNGQMKIF